MQCTLPGSPLMVTAFQRGCVRPAGLSCGRLGRRSLAGWGSQGAADPRQLLIPLAAPPTGPGQPSQSAQPTSKLPGQKTGSQPGSWLWGWELWEEGPGPTGGNLKVSRPQEIRSLCLPHTVSGYLQRLSGGREDLPGTIGLASDPGNTQPGPCLRAKSGQGAANFNSER